MFSRNHDKKNLCISLGDYGLRYLALQKNSEGIAITDYADIPLEEKVIQNGEILRADFLYTVIKKIAQETQCTEVDVLLEHDLFVCERALLKKGNTEHEPLKKRVKEYFENLQETASWQKTHVCEFFHNEDKAGRDHLLLSCLPKSIYKSYLHIFKKAGLTIKSLSSRELAFAHLMPKKRTTVVIVGQTGTRIVDIDHGLYLSEKYFEMSYQGCIQVIQESAKTSLNQAARIFSEHGLARSHKDETVYKKLMRTAGPVSEFLRKRKIKGSSEIRVIFLGEPIKGFVDVLVQKTGKQVQVFDVIENSPQKFQEILALPKSQSYAYQPEIAQNLRHFKD